MYFKLFCLALLLFSCSGRKVDRIVIRGSDTEVNLVLQLAENYMLSKEDVSVAVTGGGSGTGIASLLNKRTDIANSSRAFSDYELKLATERGLDVRQIIFAMDALCFIAHTSLPVDALSLDQIQGIYSGKIKSWVELSSYSAPLSLYGRQSNSGTYIYIRDSILRNEYALSMKQMNGSSQIVEGVKNDPAGIGYVGIGYALQENGKVVDGIKILGISTKTKEAIYPENAEEILNGNYPIVRPLFQYINGAPSEELKEFFLYELSPLGQHIIQESGYFPIPSYYELANQKTLSHESN